MTKRSLCQCVSPILDGLLHNRSEIQPDTIHGDTQAQSATVFALAYLLGITLMPRICNWKDLTFYRPTRSVRYKHVDTLFTDNVNWESIETHLPDMLRVALSVKAGKINASTVLRKLGNNSTKNKLYLSNVPVERQQIDRSDRRKDYRLSALIGLRSRFCRSTFRTSIDFNFVRSY